MSQCNSYSKFKKLSRLLMGITYEEFVDLANSIQYSQYCTGVDDYLFKKKPKLEESKNSEHNLKNSNSRFSILSEIYDLLDVINSGSAHFHYGCSCECSITTIINCNQLWEALFDLAYRKCKK